MLRLAAEEKTVSLSIVCVWCQKPLLDAEHAKEHVRRCEAAPWTAEIARLEAIIRAAPHVFACLSVTIIEGPYPTYRDAPPQRFKAREPPDESLCNCWKRGASAPS